MTNYHFSKWQLYQAESVLANEGVVACPTETVWGLGCLANSERAVRRILQIKARALSKGLILLASQPEHLQNWVAPLSAREIERLFQTNEQPTTWIFKATAAAPSWITGGRDTIAIRVTTHPLMRALCDRLGLLVSTSANRSGKQVAKRRIQCLRWFKSELDGVLPGRCGDEMVEGGMSPSTIIDWQTGQRLR